MSILTELILEGRIYSSLSVIVGNTMGGNKSFFSLLGLWETLGGLGSFWSIKINLGRLWETLGDSGGAFGEALGGFGEALGGFGDSRHPSPNNKNNYIQKCWEYANSR